MRSWAKLGRILPLFFLLTLILAGCQPSALNPVGKVATMQGQLMLLSMAIMSLVIIVVMVIFFAALIKFRKGKQGEKIPKQVEGNTILEIVWTVIPIILLIVLAVPTVYQVFVLADDVPEDGEKNAITVSVTGHQYWWEFDYKESGVNTASDLYVPTDTKVYLKLTSTDVIHSFWVPALFGKQDANPGLENEMYFISPDKPGIYGGQCAELCGPSHAFMDFKVVVVSPEKFDKWTKQMKSAPDKPETELAKKGKQIFNKTCISCHAIDGGSNKPKIGPNLAGYGNRQTIAGILEFNKENLMKWIHDAPSVKGKIDMPSFKNKLSKKQVEALATYLMDQKTGIKVNESKVSK